MHVGRPTDTRTIAQGAGRPWHHNVSGPDRNVAPYAPGPLRLRQHREDREFVPSPARDLETDVEQPRELALVATALVPCASRL